MKILLAGTRWYGNVEYFFAKAFKELGYYVNIFYFNDASKSLYERFFKYRDANLPWLSRRLSKTYKTNINRALLKKFKEVKPDLLIVFNGLQIFPETLDKLRKTNILMVNWLGDDPFRFESLKNNLKYYTHIFVTEPKNIEAIKVQTKASLEYLPNATDEVVFYPLEDSEIEPAFKSDIAFVGHSYNADKDGLYRGEILNAVSEYNLKIFGDQGWQKVIEVFPALKKCFINKITSPEETNMIYNGAKINLNIHHSQNITSTAQRTFEIASAGAFQLVEEKSEINKLFPNNEIVCFRTIEELKELTSFYINDESARKEKSEKAKLVAIQKHTYKERVKYMLAAINKKSI